MSSTASADSAIAHKSDQKDPIAQQPDVIESNHDLPARTMGEDERHEQTVQTHKDDPATMAASEELKHTSISDKTESVARVHPVNEQPESEPEDKEMGENVRVSTPEPKVTDAQDEEMRERISSPKKKRGRDQDEDTREEAAADGDDPNSSADGNTANGSRTTRSEPEKKRPRDTSEETAKLADKDVGEVGLPFARFKTPTVVDSSQTDTIQPKDIKDGSEDTKKPSELPQEKVPESKETTKVSTSAFASSGFASLAGSSTSGFGSLGASKPSVFGGSTQTVTSGFGALAGGKSPPLTSTTGGFGALSGDKPTSGFGFGSGATSGFGGLGTGSVFGSKLGNGFTGGAGPKLSSFAAPASEPAGAKPAKAFGAPESDEDEGSDDEGSYDGAASEDEESGNSPEDKKRTKPKVQVDDGEAGEATMLQLRAKLFALESKESGWKERGVGTLKINVPKACVSLDNEGHAVPGSFDASALEDEDADPNAPKVARLIMRQENTHRVILNTVIARAIKFEDKPSASSAQIMFTALMGDKEPRPVNMILKMSEANAKLFRAEIGSIQRELMM